VRTTGKLAAPPVCVAQGGLTVDHERRLDDAIRILADRPEGLPRGLIEAAKEGDGRALNQVVEAHLPRIDALARHYAVVGHVERLELVQEGVAGLLQALQHYDPATGTPLWAYARPTVERSMRRLLAELGDAASLSDGALRRLSRLKTAEDELMGEQHRLPSRDAIAQRAGVDGDEAARVLAAASPPRSLQEPVTAEDGGVIGSFGDLVDDPRATDAYDSVLDHIEAEELQSLLSVLSPRERRVLNTRYGLDGVERSRREVAEELGVSVSRVRDIEARALAKLRRAAVTAGAAR
jgi:RNA polymerase sigma factor (sigma-70 family)